jgi:hypothetical protein
MTVLFIGPKEEGPTVDLFGEALDQDVNRGYERSLLSENARVFVDVAFDPAVFDQSSERLGTIPDGYGCRLECVLKALHDGVQLGSDERGFLPDRFFWRVIDNVDDKKTVQNQPATGVGLRGMRLRAFDDKQRRLAFRPQIGRHLVLPADGDEQVGTLLLHVFEQRLEDGLAIN